MSEQPVSRRSLLAFTAACAAAVAVDAAPSASAATSPPPVPPSSGLASPVRRPPSTPLATVVQGTSRLTVFTDTQQDVAALRYVVTNAGPSAKAYTLSYTDTRTNRRSKEHRVSVGSGRSQSGTIYGRLNRNITVNFCADGEACVTLNPTPARPGAPG